MKKMLSPGTPASPEVACPPKSLPLDAVQHQAIFQQSTDLGMLIDGILHEDEKAHELARQVELARQIELACQRDLARYD